MQHDLFPDPEMTTKDLASKRLPRLGKSTGKVVADFATPAERQNFMERIQKRDEVMHQRMRIMMARAEQKATTKPRKPRKKKA